MRRPLPPTHPHVQALQLAARPVPGALYAELGRLTGSRALCAKAVHAQPWVAGGWRQLALGT